MPTTERWIEWSKNFARPYKHRNYQLYLEVAQAACRFYRDSRGLSTVPELANADHYWLARYFVFLSAGAGRDAATAHLPNYGPIGPTREEALRSMPAQIGGFFTGAVTAYALVPILTIAWDVWKRIDSRPPPIGDPPPSAPSVDQMMWAFRGCDIGFIKDANHSDQMVWGFAMNRFNTAITVPAPPE